MHVLAFETASFADAICSTALPVSTRFQAEAAERLENLRAEQMRAEEMAQEERERKEREREELRQRAARKAEVDEDRWWLTHQNKSGGKQRELAKWRARLKRFEQIAASSVAEGERDNALRLAEQARNKLEFLESQAEGGEE